MQFSQKSLYALRAVFELAKHIKDSKIMIANSKSFIEFSAIATTNTLLCILLVPGCFILGTIGGSVLLFFSPIIVPLYFISGPKSD